MEACEVALPVITLTVEITDICTLCILLPCNSLFNNRYMHTVHTVTM